MMIGTELGRYKVTDEIGSGAMGDVYKGLDTETDQVVAIKVLKSDLLENDPNLLERFKREGKALRDLNHPNIVSLLDAIEHEGKHFLIMEFVEGGDLRDLLIENPAGLSTEQALNIAIQLADALARSHYLGIIHRDLKPANILLASDGTPRLTDFGVAHLSDQTNITDPGSMVGTYAYLSPEACMGLPPDEKHDIWGFGVLFYEMLIGQRPFEGKSPGAVINNILNNAFPDPQELRSDLSDGFNDLLHRMLDKDRESRIPSVRLIGAEIESLIKGEDQTNPPIARVEQPKLGRTAFSAKKTGIPGEVKVNLPVQPTPFVGRADEVKGIISEIEDGSNRLVTLLGPGGVGKTRLALEAAHQQTDDYEHGVHFVPLAPLTSSEEIVPAIATVLGIQLSGDQPIEQIVNFLREKSLLLVMDNWEHVLDGSDIISQILNAAPGVTVIATSRERLNLQVECVYEVLGMERPDASDQPEFEEFDAVKLFVSYTRRVRPNYDLPDEHKMAVVRICDLVEGMPLGIQLAASWARSLSPDEIADELEQDLDFLETTMSDIPERQRSMRAMFDYSWNLVGEAERELFKRLSIFRGGFDRDGAKKIAGAKVRTLASLVDKSLLSRDAATGRYSIHTLVRQFAEEKLAENPQDVSDLKRGHRDHYIDMLLKWYSQKGKGQLDSLKEFMKELENIRLAAVQVIEDQDVRIIRKIGWPLMNYYQYKGWYLEYREMTKNMTASLLRCEPSEEVDMALAIAYVVEAWAYMRLGRIDDATEAATKSFQLYEKYDTFPPVDYGLDPRQPLAIVANVRGEYQEAIRFGLESYKKSVAKGDEPNTMSACYVLIGAYAGAGDFESARRYGQEGEILAEKLGYYWFSTFILMELGHVERALGNLDVAADYFRQSFQRNEEFNDPGGMAITLNYLGEIAIKLLDYGEAKTCYTKSLVANRDTGDRGGVGAALKGLGDIARLEGDHAQAMEHLLNALRISAEIQFVPLMLSVLTRIAYLFSQINREDEAIEFAAFVTHFSGSTQEAKMEAQELLEQLKDRIVKEDYESALERGEGDSFDAIVQGLLKERPR